MLLLVSSKNFRRSANVRMSLSSILEEEERTEEEEEGGSRDSTTFDLSKGWSASWSGDRKSVV